LTTYPQVLGYQYQFVFSVQIGNLLTYHTKVWYYIVKPCN